MSQPQHGGNLVWAAQVAGCHPSDLCDFSASINPLGPPLSAIAAIQSALSLLPHYPDPGYHQLRQALGDFHQISPDWILPGNGAAELLTWAAWDLAQLDATWVVTPAFGDYLRALQAVAATVRPWPLLNPAKEITPLPPRLASPHQGIILNNPHNPTGHLFPRLELLPLLEQFELVVLDEAFMDFLLPDRQQSLIDLVGDWPNLVIIRSLTKFYSLPGLRLGYAIAHPDRLRRWQSWRDPWPVNCLAVAAAAAVLSDEGFQQQTWKWLEPARSNLLTALSAIPGLSPYAGQANFLLVRSQASVQALQTQLLRQARMLIRDCASFPELGNQFFRIAVKTPKENQALVEALRVTMSTCPSVPGSTELGVTLNDR